MNVSTTPQSSDDNPYVGPRPFETGRRLFGRDSEIEDLYYLLSAERIVLLHSPSGAGKSSLIQAGLIPRLAGRFDVWGPTRVNLQPPEEHSGNRYVRSTILGFEQGIPESRRRNENELSPLSLSEYVRGRPRRRSAPENIVLIFDQFEEVLTVDPLAVEAKQEFFAQLGELLLDPRIWVLFALREDYLAPLDPYSEQVPTHLKNRFRLDLLGREAARDAIVKPAFEAGREFATEAVEKLVHDLATMKVQQPDGTFREQIGHHVEPLQLQVVCRRLWERMPADDRTINLNDVEELGNVTEALSGYYAGEVEKIGGRDIRTERGIREWVGEKLITPDGIRGQVLRGAGSSEGLDNGLIAQLVNTHLVRGEQRAGAVWYELAHDRLISPVRDDNRVWFDSHLHQVQKVAKIWGSQDEPPGLLLLGEELTAARQWAERNEASLTAVERKFLEQSVARQEAIEREKRQAARLRKLLAAVAVVALVAISAAGYAYRQKQNVERSERELQKSLATSRGLLYVANQLQAIAAYSTRNFAQAAEYLESSIPDPDMTAVPDVRSFDWYLLWRQMHDEKLTLTGHGNDVTSVLFSPDGRTLVSGDADGTVRIWDAAEEKEIRRIQNGSGAVNSMSLSADGHILAVGGTESIRLYETGNWTVLKELKKQATLAVIFAPGGRMLASGHADGAVILWDSETGEEQPPGLERHRDGVITVSFSPDGRMLLCGDLRGTVRLWEIEKGKPRLVYDVKEQSTLLTSAAFSPDGQRIAIAHGNGIVSVRDVAKRRELWKFEATTGIINSIIFSPDGRRVAAASADATVRLLDARNGQEERVLKGHTGSVRSVAFAPDGRTLASGSHDDTVKIFDLTSLPEYPRLTGQEMDVVDVQYSSDGRIIASASEDGTVAVFDVAGRRLIWRSENLGAAVNSIALTADGLRLAGGTGDGKLYLWDTAKGGMLWPNPGGHGESVKSVALSPDGRYLASGSDDNNIRILEANSGKVTRELKGHTATVNAVAFAGATLASGGDDGAVRLWDFENGREVKKFEGHKGPVSSLAFSFNGAMLASGGDDRTVRLWDVRNGNQIRALEGHELYILSIAFTPDDRILGSVSDGAVWLWDIGAGKVLQKIREGYDSVISVSFSPNNRVMACGISNGSIYMWPGATDSQILKQCRNCGLKR